MQVNPIWLQTSHLNGPIVCKFIAANLSKVTHGSDQNICLKLLLICKLRERQISDRLGQNDNKIEMFY